MTEHDTFLQNFPPNPDGYKLPPPGFEPHLSAAGFSNHNGPFYQKIEGHKNYRGFYVLDRHCNSMGIAHGGLLVSFADALLGLTVFRKTRGAPMTVRLTTDFMASAKRGDWVEGQGSVTGLANDVVYVNARVYVAERTILTAQGIFRAQKREMGG